MRFIFIVLFLISFGSVSMGGVGDMYFCNVVSDTNMWRMNHEKKSHLRETGLKKFNFKWEKSKIIIDDEFHLFIYDELPIAYTQKSADGKPMVVANRSSEKDRSYGLANITDWVQVHTDGEDFYYAQTSSTGIFTINASCTKF